MAGKRNYVDTYWLGVVQRLQAEVQVMNKLVPHAGEQGRANELTLVRLLQSLLPSSISVGSGIIIDREGNASRQTDVVLYNAADQPRIMAQTTQFLFPIETVLAAIEVKTTLDDEELGKAVACKESIDQLESATPPSFYLLAYSATLLPGTLSLKVRAHDAERQPDYICVLDVSFLSGVDRSSNTRFCGVAPLHAVDENGDRMPGSWQETDGKPGPEGRVFTRNGVNYSVTAVSQRDRTRLVCEPGRALLLFCEKILTDLNSAGHVPAPFIHHYISPLARELYTLND